MWYNKSSDTNPSKILNKEYTITIVLKKNYIGEDNSRKMANAAICCEVYSG